MLAALRLENYRRFDKHELSFDGRTLLVGPNNAGKSTVIEALRLISLVTNRFRGLQLVPTPDWLEAPAGTRGVVPSLRGLGLELGPGIFTGYGKPPAVLTATFANGASVALYVGSEERVFGVVRDPRGVPVVAKRDAVGWTLPRLGVQPQVGPLSATETLLAERTVLAARDSAMAPQHFRNQLFRMPELIADFVAAAEATWPGLQIDGLEHQHAYEGEPLSLFVRVDGFAGEIATMGHGLQMWLQMIWFLTRARSDAVVVLDEPDVFMHPDLQRRLIRYLSRRSQQLIVATHSIEMIADVEAHEIVMIDPPAPAHTSRHDKVVPRSRTLAHAQRAIEQVGGVQNVHLMRLDRSKRFIFVEGRDMRLLSRLHARLRADSLDALEHHPHRSTGGWGGWRETVGAARMVREMGGEIVVYSLFDSDYHWPPEIEERAREASAESIELHIWERKEIENYLLVPGVVARVIANRSGKGPSVEEVRAVATRLADGLYDVVVDGFMDSLVVLERGLAASSVRRRATDHVDAMWSRSGGSIARAPGKRVLSELSKWSSREFGVSFGPAAIAAAMKSSDFTPELRDVLLAVESGGRLSGRRSHISQV